MVAIQYSVLSHQQAVVAGLIIPDQAIQAAAAEALALTRPGSKVADHLARATMVVPATVEPAVALLVVEAVLAALRKALPVSMAEMASFGPEMVSCMQVVVVVALAQELVSQSAAQAALVAVATQAPPQQLELEGPASLTGAVAVADSADQVEVEPAPLVPVALVL